MKPGINKAGNDHTAPKLALIVPCFNEDAILESTIQTLGSKLNALQSDGAIDASSFIILVDDGSKDATWEIISSNAKTNPCVSGIRLSTNFGHQRALIAGLEHASGNCDLTISLDADLQDDLNAIDDMLDAFRKGNDIVFGVRNDRSSDSIFKRKSAKIFYKFMTLLGVKTIADHADFRLLSQKALSAVLAHRESNIYIRGITTSLGFTNAKVYYSRKERTGGETKYTLSKMLALAWDGITSFSTTPLRLIFYTGLFIFLTTSLASCWILYAKFFKESTIPGWASVILPIFMLGGIQLLSLGIIGEYLGKIYKESKGRPRYIIDKTTEHDSP